LADRRSDSVEGGHAVDDWSEARTLGGGAWRCGVIEWIMRLLFGVADELTGSREIGGGGGADDDDDGDGLLLLLPTSSSSTEPVTWTTLGSTPPLPMASGLSIAPHPSAPPDAAPWFETEKSYIAHV